MPWGAPVPVHGKPYYPGSYPGNMPLAGTVPVGTHNQFIPLQVSLTVPLQGYINYVLKNVSQGFEELWLILFF